jgi:hypothetical protein
MSDGAVTKRNLNRSHTCRTVPAHTGSLTRQGSIGTSYSVQWMESLSNSGMNDRRFAQECRDDKPAQYSENRSIYVVGSCKTLSHQPLTLPSQARGVCYIYALCGTDCQEVQISMLISAMYEWNYREAKFSLSNRKLLRIMSTTAKYQSSNTSTFSISPRPLVRQLAPFVVSCR